MVSFNRFVLVAAISAVASFGQSNPMSDDARMLFNQIKNNLIRAAEKMPEESYGFKPSHDVRSFGQLVGHVADAGYLFCSPGLAADAQKKAPGAEKALTTKADLVAALKASFEYCDAAYTALTDATGAAAKPFFGRDRTLNGILAFNVAHDNEHYGNMVTYMRIRGLVPPSSEPRR
jgi:uncharacterized damage-inducible protein DinB